MGLECNVIVAIIVGTILNEEITIMEQIKFDKGLTIRAGLQGPVTNSPMVPQKIIKKVPNGSERNLLCWKRLNRCNRNITMASTQTPNHAGLDMTFLPGISTLVQPLGMNGQGSTK